MTSIKQNTDIEIKVYYLFTPRRLDIEFDQGYLTFLKYNQFCGPKKKFGGRTWIKGGLRSNTKRDVSPLLKQVGGGAPSPTTPLNVICKNESVFLALEIEK